MPRLECCLREQQEVKQKQDPGKKACVQEPLTTPGAVIPMGHPRLEGPRPSLPGQLTGKWVLLGNSSLALG